MTTLLLATRKECREILGQSGEYHRTFNALQWHDGMKENAMNASTLSSEIKTVGKSGQISLGKSFAGKTLRLDRKADGSMVLTAVAIIPESQLWTLEEPHRSAIAEGMAWAAKTPPTETDLDSLMNRELSPVRTRKARAAGR